MTAFVFLVGTGGLLALPALARNVGLRLRPSEWARLNAAALIVGAIMFETALVVCALATVSGLLGEGNTSTESTAAIHHFFPGGSPAGWTALIAALGLPAVAGLSVSRTAVAGRRAGRMGPVHQSYLWEGWLVVEVRSTEALAFAVSNPSPRIIISTRLIDALNSEQLSAVLRHEAAHLRCRHPRYLKCAAALDPLLGRLPIGRTSLGMFELSIERWADEEAATSEEQRANVRLALMTLARVEAQVGVAAFNKARGVIERLEALGVPALGSVGLIRLVPYTLITALTVLAGGSFVVFFQG